MQQSPVDIRDYPVRKRKILPNFHFILPKFDFILPNFYFAPPWGISVCYRGIFKFLGGVGSEESKSVGAIGGIGRVTSVGTHDLCVRSR